MAERRVERVTLEGGGIAWRKTYGDSGRRWRMAALRWLARRLGLNALLAPVPLAAESACRTEFEMIQRLAGLGVRVPHVMQRNQTQLLLSNLGPTLGLLCKREPDLARRSEMLKRGFDALLELHARGAYVSQAVARNLTLDEQGVGFIDLEEDPLQMMSLAAAQARDALLWVQSSARFLADDPEQYARLLEEFLTAERSEVRAEILLTARRLRWLALPARLGGTRGRAFSQALTHLADARS